MHMIIMDEGCYRVSSCGDFRQLVGLKAQPKPAREHQREIQSRKVSLDNPIDNRKDHHTWGQDKPKNHTDYTQPIGPRDKPENILQHPGDQRDQHTHRPQRIFERIHRALNLRARICRGNVIRCLWQPMFLVRLILSI